MDRPETDIDSIFDEAANANADVVKFTWPTPTLDDAWPLWWQSVRSGACRSWGWGWGERPDLFAARCQVRLAVDLCRTRTRAGGVRGSSHGV